MAHGISLANSAKNTQIKPVDASRWSDFETLMGEKGGCGGCWCMLWRLSNKEWEANKGAGNKQAIKAIVEKGPAPGLIAYDGDNPVGWCSLAPRSSYPRLEKSRVLKPVDDRPVWSVSCFFIDKAYRKQGLSVALLKAACDFVVDQSGDILEGYPIAPNKDPYPAVYAWTGIAKAFVSAGFKEVARRSPTRPVMRKQL